MTEWRTEKFQMAKTGNWWLPPLLDGSPQDIPEQPAEKPKREPEPGKYHLSNE